jgi:DNA polymerase-3 subunit gamma/tau
MGQALYRKYRSKSLNEVIGQEHITKTLEHSLKQGTISHAYLFTGPRGVGKTSVARILAHAVNNLDYTDESIDIDIIEIDAASNNGVENVRDLREKAYVSPTSAPYKVYIIDEVHMLSKPAFNALLKILEEPPEHVIFILATTESSKLPETIISRTQRFMFRPVEPEKVIAHLRDISKREKIKIDDESLSLIAQHGEGSFRDSISLLDQMRNIGSDITADEVLNLLGQAPLELIEDLESAIATNDLVSVTKNLQVLHDRGYEPGRIAQQLGITIRESFLSNSRQLSPEQSLGLLAKLIDVPSSADPAIALEIAVLSSLKLDQPIPTKPKVKLDEPLPEVKPTPSIHIKKSKQIDIDESTDKEAIEKTPPPEISDQQTLKSTVDNSIWPQILSAIKKKHNTLYSIVRMAQPEWEGETLTLAFKFAFHQKNVNEPRHKTVIAETIHDITGQNITLKCIVDATVNIQPQATKEPVDKELSTDPTIASISNIFGGAELLES